MKGDLGLKEFLITYKGIALYEDNLILVRANSTKEALTKFHDYMVNNMELFVLFEDCLTGTLEGEYFDSINKGTDEKFDWNETIERFLRSKKGFDNKRRFKNLDLDKFVHECLDITSDIKACYNKASKETKEAIFIWMHEGIDALNLAKFRVLE